MKEQSLILTELHPVSADPAAQVVRRVVTVWLTKELHK